MNARFASVDAIESTPTTRSSAIIGTQQPLSAPTSSASRRLTTDELGDVEDADRSGVEDGARDARRQLQVEIRARPTSSPATVELAVDAGRALAQLVDERHAGEPHPEELGHVTDDRPRDLERVAGAAQRARDLGDRLELTVAVTDALLGIERPADAADDECPVAPACEQEDRGQQRSHRGGERDPEVIAERLRLDAGRARRGSRR